MEPCLVSQDGLLQRSISGLYTIGQENIMDKYESQVS